MGATITKPYKAVFRFLGELHTKQFDELEQAIEYLRGIAGFSNTFMPYGVYDEANRIGYVRRGLYIRGLSEDDMIGRFNQVNCFPYTLSFFELTF